MPEAAGPSSPVRGTSGLSSGPAETLAAGAGSSSGGDVRGGDERIPYERSIEQQLGALDDQMQEITDRLDDFMPEHDIPAIAIVRADLAAIQDTLQNQCAEQDKTNRMLMQLLDRVNAIDIVGRGTRAPTQAAALAGMGGGRCP